MLGAQGCGSMPAACRSLGPVRLRAGACAASLHVGARRRAVSVHRAERARSLFTSSQARYSGCKRCHAAMRTRRIRDAAESSAAYQLPQRNPTARASASTSRSQSAGAGSTNHGVGATTHARRRAEGARATRGAVRGRGLRSRAQRNGITEYTNVRPATRRRIAKVLFTVHLRDAASPATCIRRVDVHATARAQS